MRHAVPKSAHKFPRSVAPAIAILSIAVAADVGCVSQTSVPALTGPSTFATSINIAATPTVLNRDGSSQSAIAVTVYDANGRPLSGLPLRVDIYVGCNPSPTTAGSICQDGSINNTFGTLSVQTIVSGTDGKANTMYTAPPLPSSPTVSPEATVSIIAMPKMDSSGEYDPARRVRTDIRLVPPGVIQPPALVPTALFAFTPSSPTANSPVQFDGSASCAGPLDSTTGKCPGGSGTITQYRWDFGDGSGSTTPAAVVSHAFALQQTYTVTLWVTNDRGIVSSPIPKAVTIGAGSLPIPAFVFGPTPVQLSTPVNFDATASRPGAGHQITTYTWNWGDGTPSGGGVTTSHSFKAAGVFTVVLTVTDEAGQQNTISQTVNVGTGAPNAVFTFGVTNALTHTVTFDGSGSTALGTATIDPATGYAWAFGDGLAGTGPIVSHTYTSPGTYTVRLTVTDSLGRTGSSTQNVTVP
jgi:PKD repeat protein